MCLGIPGQVIELLDGYGGQLALVDVSGAPRKINIGMLELDQQDLAAGRLGADPHGLRGRADRRSRQPSEALQGLELMGRPRDDAQRSASPAPAAPEVTGPVLFARYAFPPNSHGYCGPADTPASSSSGWPATTAACERWPSSSPAPGRIWS